MDERPDVGTNVNSERTKSTKAYVPDEERPWSRGHVGVLAGVVNVGGSGDSVYV